VRCTACNLGLTVMENRVKEKANCLLITIVIVRCSVCIVGHAVKVNFRGLKILNVGHYSIFGVPSVH